MTSASAVPGIRRRTRRLRVEAAGCAVAALCVVTAAPAVADGGRGGAKPTIVLVHGAFADGSSWNGVIERLERKGYTVMAPANPLRGLYSDSAYIASVLKTVKGPVVLAGHSYGGAVISTAAAGNPQVKSLVYVSALMPDVGESGMSLSARFPSALGTATTSVPYQAGGVSGTDLYLKRDKVHPVFAACLSAGEANLLAVTQRPAATTAFSEKAKAAAWKDIPSWALVGRQDMTINPEQERFEAKRAHSHTVEIDTCHVSLVARPDAVADLILQAATATTTATATNTAATDPAHPTLATTGTPGRGAQAITLGGIAGASVAAGSAVVLLGRRLRHRTH
ncbi:alpha/beta hydrolase [Streptomyces sp. NBC_01340]|uniref:alpha/beta fold hydrolase n=1 Tax=unclassified Streptomyces TaxID=2593676 RepID=UPI002259A5FE|nr:MULTISPECIES: alpha/beta hydrolase [unclassified Streptomyces]MCX4454846.1 alpha/beta hydrolase [Streptomyces sp. NBC_01719]MCX4494206.1 alpha/beta hydrolase [Streptomyces sp. NBC_01728]MCX4591283.1 alpha/beta hydrolase [Streptomyces sp. NBC_01549]WSI39268.1 alpha/beta hydrolase [Streptomyces sp. NBC_01340]